MCHAGRVPSTSSRRSFLAAAGSCALSAWAPPLGAAESPSTELERIDLGLDGDRRIARRAMLLVPKHLPAGTKLPLLVLLHGLGETGNELLGIHAWADRYGLAKAYERLRHPPLSRTLPKQRYLTDAHLAELNQSLSRRPFSGVVMACPVTPNPHAVPPAARTLDRYADWIADTLLPAVRQRAPVLDGAAHTGLDGCSLGGYVGLEVFLRRPELFGTLGGVQAAMGSAAARRYARRIAGAIQRVGPRPIHVETSTGDPFRKANKLLATELDRLGVPNVFQQLPGPHNQPFLREIGTLEMLLWHDRQLRPHG